MGGNTLTGGLGERQGVASPICYGLAPMSPEPPRSRQDPIDMRRLLSVQVLRAVAALSVVVHHAGYDADTIAQRFGATSLDLDRWFDWTFGIHLFFVISGFIMVRTARRFGQPGASLRFLARRALRVVPLYWLATSLVLIGAAVAPSLLNVPVDGSALWLGSSLFVPVTRINGEIRPVLGQGWTLDYEMFFYVVFALGMVLPRRAGLPLIAATLIGLVLLGHLLRPTTPAFVVWTDGLLLEFLLGIGVGLASERGVRLAAAPACLLAAAGLAAAVLLRPGGSAPPLEAWIASGLPAAAIVLACVCGPAWRPVPPVLWAAALGDASYSLYLTHPFATRLLRVGWTEILGAQGPAPVFAALAVLVAVGVGFAVHRLIERPMTDALHRRFPLTDRRHAHRGPVTRPDRP